MDKMQKKLIADRWDEAHEKQLETLLQENEGMRKLFEEHPEKKELYKFKILDSESSYIPGVPLTTKQCETCIFCLVRPPFGRLPNNAHCRIYDNSGKPSTILYDGEPCEYYEREKRKPKQ